MHCSKNVKDETLRTITINFFFYPFCILAFKQCFFVRSIGIMAAFFIKVPTNPENYIYVNADIFAKY